MLRCQAWMLTALARGRGPLAAHASPAERLVRLGSAGPQRCTGGRPLKQLKQTRSPCRCSSHTLPSMLFKMPATVCSLLRFLPQAVPDSGNTLQDPFATKEEYHDGPFAQFMIDTFSKRMSSSLGGEPFACAA